MQNVQTNLLTSTITIIILIGFITNFSSVSALRINNRFRRNSTEEQEASSVVRHQKIMHGFSTREGEFGWQASLELLHPSLGFIGHWCGGVLIHKYWILSSAHCVHNDLFNLPLPALWTVVLGENNRMIETGYEQRISVDKIIMHEKYRQFKNDLVLMKLTRAANLSSKSRVHTIFLPSSSHIRINPSFNAPAPVSSLQNTNNNNDDDKLFDRNENFLRKIQTSTEKGGVAGKEMEKRNKKKEPDVNFILDKIKQINLNEVTRRSKGQFRNDDNGNIHRNATTKPPSIIGKKNKRRNDKFLHRRPTNPEDYELFMSVRDRERPSSIDYYDCMTAGWGKFSSSGDLSDVLLKIDVPIHNIKRCEDVYSGYVSLHTAQHLCAGRVDATGGSCIGDSGGGLQCKLDKNGPWVLVGITSFGSGCAKEGYADVFTNVAYYRNWIDNVIRNN